MSVSVRKVEGVESAQVSLKAGIARITLQPGNTVTLAQIRDLVKRNGFTPQQASVQADAEVVSEGDRLQVKIRGVNESFQIAAEGNSPPVDVRKLIGTPVRVTGVISMPTTTQPPAITVASIKKSDGP